MTKITVWMLVVALAGIAARPTSATTEVSFGRSDMLLLMGDGISIVANAATMATGDRNPVMGWLGVGLGAASMIIGFTSEDGGSLAAGGVIAAAAGILSLTGGREDEELDTHNLKLVPGFARGTDGEIETRLTLKLNF
jgi:hypothetical protein